MLNDAQQINTNNPRESRVVSDGNYVIKTPVSTNKSHIAEWLRKQHYANMVVGNLLAYKDKVGGYFIPKIINISDGENPSVREERVRGDPITAEYFAKLLPEQQESIYKNFSNFLHDINHCNPVHDLEYQLGNGFADIIEKTKSYLLKEDIIKITQAYELFKSHQEMVASFVFAHGDMNENNIFYDKDTDTLSIIDFAEAKYESADYMFNHDVAKLTWLDTNKLIQEYAKISPYIRIKSNPDMLKLFNDLRSIQWTGESLIAQPKNSKIYMMMLHENITKLEKDYVSIIEYIKNSKQFHEARRSL
ncbi:MAG: phosphotransferase [Alphaproteobacteria bacterium]|nr:phosphotransferase [Alphaproteobacteria bacterium]